MRLILADIAASVVFFTVAAGLSEAFIVGLSPAQVLDARLAAIPLMALAARPYGAWRDFAFRRARVGDRGRVATALIDTGVFISFQLPVYAAILVWVGATWAEIAVACAATVGLMLIAARPYGAFLDLVRRLFGASPDGRPA